jgi:asparagine synthase (glutamine-hydrolysing)
MKAILMHPEINRNLHLGALDVYLALNYSAGPETLIEGIEKLPPGHWLQWRDGAITSNAYWRLHLEDRSLAVEEACEQLDSLMQASVREHMLSDVPLGVWLSDGIDSSTVLHYASARCQKRLQSYSVSFAGRSFDESPYITEMVRRYNTEHHQMDLNPKSDLEPPFESLPITRTSQS